MVASMDYYSDKLRATYQEVSDLITSQSKNDTQSTASSSVSNRPRRFSRKKATSAPSIIADWNKLSIAEESNLSASTRRLNRTRETSASSIVESWNRLSIAEQSTAAPARNSSMFSINNSNSNSTIGASPSFDNSMLSRQSPQTVVGKSFGILGTKNSSTSNKFKPKDLTLA